MSVRTDITRGTPATPGGRQREPRAAAPTRGRPRRVGGRPGAPGRPRPDGQERAGAAPGPAAGPRDAGRVRLTAPARPRTRPASLRPSRPLPDVRRPLRRAAEPAGQARTRFVFLVLGLLGGGLLCLLLVNTVLATGSFQINALQQGNFTLAQREHALAAQIAAEQSPSSLARRARKLGMVEPPLIHFLNLRTGRIDSQPSHAKGMPNVPGYPP